MAGIFDEENMRRVLGKYIPKGETLVAGVHGVSKETNIKGLFGKCRRGEDRFVPCEKGETIVFTKKKHAPYDVYVGLTQSALLVAGCEPNQYAYSFDRGTEDCKGIREVTEELLWADIGTCFPLAEIQRKEIKKGLMGAVNCSLFMENGSYFKLLLPKRGGLGGGMPHHEAYREAILAALEEKDA